MKKTLPIVDVNARSDSGKPVPSWPAGPPRSILRQKRAELATTIAGRQIEADPFNIIILNYTMKCPLACDYCCYSCGPLRTETMPLELALSIVEQAGELGVFGEAGFTGGDPMVLFDDVLTIAARMQSVGLPFSMISACDWAVDGPTKTVSNCRQSGCVL
jgi:hypothetical protein